MLVSLSALQGQGSKSSSKNRPLELLQALSSSEVLRTATFVDLPQVPTSRGPPRCGEYVVVVDGVSMAT